MKVNKLNIVQINSRMKIAVFWDVTPYTAVRRF
jgi:hypothetical protein